ncbi:MAG: phosphotransferase [Candidatus Accumulibacter sp.]|jgi:5-methylthioribose kinase|nr:phosphotransferase [Accumulibacter sp.]
MIDISNEDIFRDYLAERGLVRAGEELRVTEMKGGISCEVLLVETRQDAFVVKQALPKLRVKEDWFSDMTRLGIEQACLRYWDKVVPELVPRFRFYDGENYLYGMEAAPVGAPMWKSLLMKGSIDFSIGRQVAAALARVHDAAAADRDIWQTFADQKVFVELRINPYLRTVAERHPALKPLVEREVERLQGNRLTLVHGDYSPKNVLVAGERLYILDFEVAHIGDPSFDLAFLSNHFLLKAVKNRDWAPAYLALLVSSMRDYLKAIRFTDRHRLEEDTVRTLALLFLARVDGKSPAEYITEEEDKALIRALAYQILNDGLTRFDQVAVLAWHTLRAARSPKTDV